MANSAMPETGSLAGPALFRNLHLVREDDMLPHEELSSQVKSFDTPDETRENTALRARGDAMAVDVLDPLDVAISWNQLDLGLD
ncbi:hypothetical protein [Nocardia sp. NPDC059228]|uniref:hypothetical protein n=1 Tax=Nocardia sp. NPDC059228 TaxID=3346777 RepID=UPI0036B83B32